MLKNIIFRLKHKLRMLVLKCIIKEYEKYIDELIGNAALVETSYIINPPQNSDVQIEEVREVINEVIEYTQEKMKCAKYLYKISKEQIS